MRYLYTRPEQVIAIVTHSNVIKHVFGAPKNTKVPNCEPVHTVLGPDTFHYVEDPHNMYVGMSQSSDTLSNSKLTGSETPRSLAIKYYGRNGDRSRRGSSFSFNGSKSSLGYMYPGFTPGSMSGHSSFSSYAPNSLDA